MLRSLSAKLDESDLGAITALEKALAKALLTFSFHPLKPAVISKEQRAMLQEIDNKLGISVVADSSWQYDE